MATSFPQASAYSYLGSKDALGGLPVVESTKAYIATFKGVVSADPEVIANSSFFITYDNSSNYSNNYFYSFFWFIVLQFYLSLYAFFLIFYWTGCCANHPHDTAAFHSR